jgi:hypothetical protein
MAYVTPHPLIDYLSAATLRINHEYVLHCQRRSDAQKRKIVLDLREIDLCARISDYFGRVGHLAAQGVHNTQAADIEISGPTIRCEVKYFRPSVRTKSLNPKNWGQLQRDWHWLLGPTNTGGEFNKRAWVVFWPTTSLYKFTTCLTVTRSHGTRFSVDDFAPFCPYVEPEYPKNGVNQRLTFKPKPFRESLIDLGNGKRVRCNLIGATTNPIWAAIYTRVTPSQAQSMSCNTVTVNGDAIDI